MKEATHTVRFEPGYGGGPSAGFFEHVLQAFNSSEMIENSFAGGGDKQAIKENPMKRLLHIELRLKILELRLKILE